MTKQSDPIHNNNSIAVMQPYVFPHIGYFHLIHASNIFVYYDDVAYIKRGWINRNRMLNHGKDLLFTIPINKASYKVQVNETKFLIDDKWINNFGKQLTRNYKKAPFFSETFELVLSVFSSNHKHISKLAIESIQAVCSYLEVPITALESSITSPHTKGLERADRLIAITKELGATTYINTPGGKKLYEFDYFHKEDITLRFIKSDLIEYPQFGHSFVPGLSIIDVLMFNSPEAVLELLTKYELEGPSGTTS